MISPMPISTFGPYWFQSFAAIMILGEVESVEHVVELETRGVDWGQVCLGSFYVKPNYPGTEACTRLCGCIIELGAQAAAVMFATAAFSSQKRPEIEVLGGLWVKVGHASHMMIYGRDQMTRMQVTSNGHRSW